MKRQPNTRKKYKICTIQLVPANDHRWNLAEKAIQTFKSHFKAILAGVDDTLPMQLWDKLLPQTITTLNLLRQSNAVPAISAYQYVRGNFDYNKTPLAPLGCAVQMHESRDRWGTWAKHFINGWYLGTSPEHYQSYIIYTIGTQSERISDTVFFKTKFITQPTLTPADNIVKAIADLTNTLKGTRNTEGIQEIKQLKQLDNLLNNIPQTITEMPLPLHQTTEDNPITESRVTNTPAPERKGWRTMQKHWPLTHLQHLSCQSQGQEMTRKPATAPENYSEQYSNNQKQTGPE